MVIKPSLVALRDPSEARACAAFPQTHQNDHFTRVDCRLEHGRARSSKSRDLGFLLVIVAANDMECDDCDRDKGVIPFIRAARPCVG